MIEQTDTLERIILETVKENLFQPNTIETQTKIKNEVIEKIKEFLDNIQLM